jgi:hypothetical protein
VRGTDLGERLPIDFGTFTCSCGEGIGDGHSKLEELIVGDLNKGVKWLVNVLRSVDGEFGRMAVRKTIITLSLVNLKKMRCSQVEDVAEGIKLGDELAGLRLDHGPDSENFDLRLFEASSSESVVY